MIAVIIRILDRRTGVGERTEEEIFEYMAKKAQKKVVFLSPILIVFLGRVKGFRGFSILYRTLRFRL